MENRLPLNPPLRPPGTGWCACRVRLRLEAEVLQLDALEAAAAATAVAGAATPSLTGVRPLRVVHCYGHGGSGLTLAHGTAQDAAALVLELLAGDTLT
jgi:hypothetical protein